MFLRVLYPVLADHLLKPTYPLLADLRVVQLGKYSLELSDTIKLMQGRLFWYREFLLAEGASKLDFVGSFQNNLDVHAHEFAHLWIGAASGLLLALRLCE